MNLLMIMLPVLLIFATGYLAQKKFGFDIKSISRMALYIMSPALAFRTFYANEITIDYYYILLFSFGLNIILALIVGAVSYFTKATRQQMSAMMLGGIFMNQGNYGAPIVLFAFGAAGFDYAVIMMVFQSFLMNTVGLFFASLGGEEGASIKESLRRMVRMPVLHGAVLGVVLQLTGVSIPVNFMDAISLVADASIPTVMLILGMQLAVISRKRVAYRFVSIVTVIRMVISPVIAIIAVHFMPIPDLLKHVFIIQAAMPSAANTTMLAVQFNTEPDLVSFTTFITTILSIISIPLILIYIGV
ncbi:AEC family transporter [Bacillus mesophilum]|uniref:AEC family transporter n=1 Tax=Bacillus mesophilum TaxID=1071718 RepID=A0A7V7UV17_9BACI|nr:AEC family transporter [Bacillus mesophilum]KAB2331828.1 AEC family transporter [Bacillus mesophilum]